MVDNSPVQSNLSDGVDVLVVGPQQVVNDNASPLVHLDARSASDLITGTGGRNGRTRGRFHGTVQINDGKQRNFIDKGQAATLRNDSREPLSVNVFFPRFCFRKTKWREDEHNESGICSGQIRGVYRVVKRLTGFPRKRRPYRRRGLPSPRWRR